VVGASTSASTSRRPRHAEGTHPKIKVGETGYFYVLNAAPGKNQGDLLVHPAKEGQNILGSRDADGREFVKEMLDKKDGTDQLPDWQNPGETSRAHQGRRLRPVQGLELGHRRRHLRRRDHREAARLRNRYILAAWSRWRCSPPSCTPSCQAHRHAPAGTARDAAVRIAQGDLTVDAGRARRDEIGLLAEAMNDISRKLSAVVGQVRIGAEQIANASSEISSGNLDLCTRTEQQAASLASTANSMQDLTETVRQNAGDAQPGQPAGREHLAGGAGRAAAWCAR
jgi:methyl-accepting chemotaxis protein